MNWTKSLKTIVKILVAVCFWLIAIGFMSSLFMGWWYDRANPDFYERLPEPVKLNYGHMTPGDVEVLLRGTWNFGFEYEEVLGFKEEASTIP